MIFNKNKTKIIIILGIITLFIISIVFYLIFHKNKCIPNCSGLCNGESDKCGGVCNCPTGKFCNGGSCVSNIPCIPTCSSEQSCQSGVCKCDTSKCPLGESCQSGICKTKCDNPCTGDKICIAPNTCGYTCNQPCTGGEICIGPNICGYTCNPLCNSGEVCTDGNKCICSANTCDQGNTCSPDLRCVPDVIVVVGLKYDTTTPDNTTGVIYVSNDGINSWKQNYNGDETSFNGIAFNGIDTWVAVGDTGVFYSTDNAKNWNITDDLNCKNCNGVLWIDSKKMWVVIGNDITSPIYYSTNKYISSLTPIRGLPFNKCSSIIFNPNNIFIAVCTSTLNSPPYISTTSIYTTSDITTNWTNKKVLDNFLPSSFCGLSCYDDTCILAYSTNTQYTWPIILSTDNGNTWNFPTGTKLGNNNGTAISCNSSGRFVVVQNRYCEHYLGQSNCISYSEDKGKTWVPSIIAIDTFSSCYDSSESLEHGAYAVTSYKDNKWIVVGNSPSNYPLSISTDNGQNFIVNDTIVGPLWFKGIAVGF
jgi:hypothetical protein